MYAGVADTGPKMSEGGLHVPLGKIKLLGLYLLGFAHVFLRVFVAAVLAMWVLQFAALSLGANYDWANVLTHLFLSLSLLAFFPGQRIWTFQLTARDGTAYTIIGPEPAEAAD